VRRTTQIGLVFRKEEQERRALLREKQGSLFWVSHLEAEGERMGIVSMVRPFLRAEGREHNRRKGRAGGRLTSLSGRHRRAFVVEGEPGRKRGRKTDAAQVEKGEENAG